MAKFEDVRTVAGIGEHAGLSRQDRRKLIEEPRSVIGGLMRPSDFGPEDSLQREFAARISPSDIKVFLNALSGGPCDAARLWKIGETLYGLVSTSDDERRRTRTRKIAHISEGQKKILDYAVAAVEEALYSGSLAHLHGVGAGTLTFVVNRLAKIAHEFSEEAERESRRGYYDFSSHDRDENSRQPFAFNTQQFQRFADRVNTFAQQQFSPETLRKNVLAVYAKEEEVMRERGAADEILLAVAFLDEKIASVDLAFTEEDVEQANASLQEYFKRIYELRVQREDGAADPNIGRVLNMVQIIARGTNISGFIERALSGNTVLSNTYHNIYDPRDGGVQSSIDALRRSAGSGRSNGGDEGKARKSIPLADLQQHAKQYIASRRADVLEEWQLLSFLGGKIGSAVQRIVALTKEREALLSRVKDMRDVRSRRFAFQTSLLGIQPRREVFEESMREVVRRNLGLYFVKTFLVAADCAEKGELTPGGGCVEFDHSREYVFGASPVGAGQISIHYMDGEVPFADMAVAYCRSLPHARRKHTTLPEERFAFASRAQEREQAMQTCLNDLERRPDVVALLRPIVERYQDLQQRDTRQGSRAEDERYSAWEAVLHAFQRYPEIFPKNMLHGRSRHHVYALFDAVVSWLRIHQ